MMILVAVEGGLGDAEWYLDGIRGEVGLECFSKGLDGEGVIAGVEGIFEWRVE